MTASKPPILVTGSHRCGSTWVGRTLARSPSVAFLDEPFHPRHRRGNCRADWDHWYAYVCEENAARYEAALRDTLALRYSPFAELRAVRGIRDAARLVRDAGRSVGGRLQRKRALMKDPIAFFSAPWLAATFDMQVVVLARHPAAFASSLKRLNWRFDVGHWLDQPLLMRDWLAPWEDALRSARESPERDVIDEAALCWSVVYDVAARFRERFPNWIFLRHEDLSLDPVGEYGRLFERLGVAFTPDVERWLEVTTGSANPAEAPAGTAHALARDSRANVRNWEQRLTPAEVARLRTGTRDVADRWYAADEW